MVIGGGSRRRNPFGGKVITVMSAVWRPSVERSSALRPQARWFAASRREGRPAGRTDKSHGIRRRDAMGSESKARLPTTCAVSLKTDAPSARST